MENIKQVKRMCECVCAPAHSQTHQSFVLEPLVEGCTLARPSGLLRSGVSIYISLSSYLRAHKVTEGWTAFHQLASYSKAV